MQLSRLKISVGFVLAFVSAGVATADAGIAPGDLIVTVYRIGGTPEIVDVNPTTGIQTLITSGGDLVEPDGLTIDSSGNIIVSDYGGNIINNNLGSIISVTPSTGQQKVLASGGDLIFPAAIAIDSTGNLIAATQGRTQTDGDVVRVNPATGAQALITTGYPLFAPTGVVVGAGGNYFVSNYQDQGYGTSIEEVNATTGAQNVVWSGYSSTGAAGIALDHFQPGDLLVAYDPNPGTFTGILDINTDTGGTTILSEGGLLDSPNGVTQDNSGDIFASNGTGSIVEINPANGDQTLIASGGYLSEGIGGIAIVPEPSLVAILSIGALLVFRPRRNASAVSMCAVPACK